MDTLKKVYSALSILIILFFGTNLFAANEYICPDAPSVKMTPYAGDRYEAMVPDTLDIAEQSKLAIHGLTSPLDENDDCSLYWLVNYWNPAMLKETYPNIVTKYMEALPLLRIATGSELNTQVDQVWMNCLLKRVGPDGLLYMNKQNGQFYPLAGVGTSRLLRTMLIYYLRDHDQNWKDIIQKCIIRLSELCVDKGEYAYFPNYVILTAKPDAGSPEPKGIAANDYPHARLIEAMGHYYRFTGFEPAKKLGDKFVNFIRFHSEYFGPNGEWLKDQINTKQYPGRDNDLHFGTHSHVLLYMTDYAISTKNTELLDYCKKSFEWGKIYNSKLPGQSEIATYIGFFLEYLKPYYPTAETCSVADMIAVGLKLSQAGQADYFDDVDRWIRNHFIENQIKSSQWCNDLPRPQWPRTASKEESTVRVAERNVGSFMSWPSANDGLASSPQASEPAPLTPSVSVGHMHCCTGNGARTLYYIWESILENKDGVLKINLLLNRASPWVDIDSYIPYIGRVDLKVKQQLKEIQFRAPEWVAAGSKDIKCSVNNSPRNIDWDGRYLKLGAVNPKDIVTVEFPIAERKIVRNIYTEPVDTAMGGVLYNSIVLRGNTVVEIKPAGKNYPYYQRADLRQDRPRWIKVERFVSQETIPW